MQKWDTIRFVDFYLAMQLANEINYYTEQQKSLSEICKRSKYECDLELVLKNEDFFIESNKYYLALRSFIFNKISTGLDFYRINDFKDNILF